MRRQKPIAVKVKAPSRGLVSRWPSETADLMGPADLKRTCVVAENMRFEDGVMCAAPGFERVQVSGIGLLANLVSHWRMEEVDPAIASVRLRADANGTNDLTVEIGVYQFNLANIWQQVDGKLGKASKSQDARSLPGPISANPYMHSSATALGNLAAGAHALSAWLRIDDLSTNNILFSYSGVVIKQAGTHISCDLGAGPTTHAFAQTLTAGTWFHLVFQFSAGTVTVYVNNVSDTFAFALSNTGSPVFKVSDGAAGSLSSGLSFDSVSAWSRVLTGAEVTALYNGGSGLDYPFSSGAPSLLYEGNLVGATPRPVFAALGTGLYSVAPGFIAAPRTYQAALTSIYAGTAPTAGYNWRAADFYDKVIFAQRDNVPQYFIPGGAASSDVPGMVVNSTNQYSATSDSNEKFEGVEAFAGHLLFWRKDVLVWSDLNDFSNYIPVGLTAVSDILTLTSGFTQPAVGAVVDADFTMLGTVPLIVGQYVRLIFASGGATYYNYYTVQKTLAGSLDPTTTKCGLKLLGTTGRFASAGAVPNGSQIFTLDANEAGTSQLVGANANGPILRVTSMGDYAYVFKEWSIQSLQYVGQGSGVFYQRTEVVKEGLIGKNAMVNIGNGQIIFLGHRELYSFQGGAAPAPSCRQYTRQLYRELDRTRLDEILLIHRELRNEVWVVYPVQGGNKVLIWNYLEDTASIDVYDASLSGLTAATRTQWTEDPAWNTGSDTALWDTFDQTESWASFSDTGTQELLLVACGNGVLFIHGQVYDRMGAAYTALAETMDYDFGDNTVFKYVDVVHVGIQILATDSVTRTLFVQVGGKTALDGDITWTAPQAINVKGGANFTTKVNPGGAGRYLRLRFYSQDVDVQWRVSSFEIFCRAGGTY